MLRVTMFLLATVVMAAVCGCKDRSLRGKSVRSADGKTYFVLDDDNGGGCLPFYLDGREWSFPLHSPAPIEPGTHTISCGVHSKDWIGFDIKAGTTFHFDYWGP